MNSNKFKRFGTLIDCSRNGVPKVSTVEKWIDLTADLGYNMLMLYTEDTYEVNDNPYFGYGRGRYSKEELRRMDRYASEKGMELIPCIQTLAHLQTLVRWKPYVEISDIKDILLADDERTYQLIDKMFETVSECFRSKIVNIGMDEAAFMGRGRYYNTHGHVDHTELFLRHLNRVAEIAQKYGLTLCMWSDMFFKLATGGEYYLTEMKYFDKKVAAKIPQGVELIYWDYYSVDKNRYDLMLQSHNTLKAGTWFAGGFACWTGFAPHNMQGIETSRAALASCLENGVENVFMTLWGDDGAECSMFATLPSLFCASEFVKGITDMAVIKKHFQDKFHIPFDDFMLLDLLESPNGRGYSFRSDKDDGVRNADKYLLYNDPFTGLFDSTLAGDENAIYGAAAKKLEGLKNTENYGYLFDVMENLCQVLSVKAQLGQKTREAYSAKDKAALQALLADYDAVSEKLDAFYESHRRRWMKENKAQGFEIQDMRLGGLARRMESCKRMLEEYLAGTISQIDELEEPLLDLSGQKDDFGKKEVYFNNWGKNISPNALGMNLFFG